MQIAVAAVFLSILIALLIPAVQSKLQKLLVVNRLLVFAVPLLLSAIFCAFTGLGLAPLILAYTLIPTFCVFAGIADLVVILLLWIPVEFNVGQSLIPKSIQAPAHTAAYGVGLTLALTLFLLFRRRDGLKYNLPRTSRDWIYPLIGFAFCAATIIPVGRMIGFLPPFHLPDPWYRPIREFPLILAGTALPEEILFRSLIQNLLMQKFGANTRTLLLAALIFGAAHLDNGPQPLPNWRYMIVATIAGAAYGKVFEKSTSVFASAGLHTLVDMTKHSCF